MPQIPMPDDLPPNLQAEDFARALLGPGGRRMIGLKEKVWILSHSFWTFQIGGWCLFSLIPIGIFLSNAFTDPMMRWILLIRPVTGFLITLGCWPLCSLVFKRDYSIAKLFLLILAASLVIGSLELIGSIFLGRLLGIPRTDAASHGIVAAMLLMRSGILFLWFVLYFGLKNLRRSIELERRSRAAELHFLCAQVNPHFLFNALTSIMVLCKENHQAVALTRSLCEYLRFSLQQGEQQWGDQLGNPGEGGMTGYVEKLHPLGEELDALKSYLEVKKARFQEDLEYHLEVEEDAAKVCVPSSLVQPILENAIKYGQKTSPKPLRIKIMASISNAITNGISGKLRTSQKTLMVSVQNSGSWVEPHLAKGQAASLGTGLKNLSRRLQLIYGEAASLEWKHNGGLVTAQLSLPVSDTGDLR